MSKIGSLKEKMNGSYKVLVFAIDCFKYSRYLHSPKNDLEREYLYSSEHLYFIAHLTWRITVIEIAKLISNSKNDKYSILRIVKNFEPGNEYSRIGISEDMVKNWNQILEDCAPAMEVLRKLRNDIYAHSTNENFSKEIVDISFSDIEKIVSALKKIIKDLFGELLETDPLFISPVFDGKVLNILEVLAEQKKESMEGLMAKFINSRHK